MSLILLPDGWVSDKLENLIEITTGKTPSRSNTQYWNGGIYKWATISDMSFGKNIVETRELISSEAVEENNLALVKKGTLLFSFKLTIGKMAFAGCDIYTNEAIAAFEPKDERISERFLFYALQVANLTLNSGDSAKGATLNSKTLPLIKVSFPKDIIEQNRIVRRIEELNQRAELIIESAIKQEKKLNDFLQSIYFQMIIGVDWKPLKEVASLVRRKIETKPEEEYEEMGIRSFGRGTFKKPVLTGRQIGGKRIYRIHEGDLIFSNVFAWEKAIAVAQKEDHGRVGSHRYISFVPHEKQATSEFLCHHFLSERGIEDIRAASPGSAGRNCTLGLKKLEIIKVPVPDFGEQEKFSELVKRHILIGKEKAAIKRELNIFNSAVIAKSFRGEL